MRLITQHQVNDCNKAITIGAFAADPKTGASYAYQLLINRGHCDPELWGHATDELTLLFQRGPIAEVGVNGVTNEAVITILIDRLEGFQTGPFACDENEDALMHLRLARAAMFKRTKARMERGVEGTHEV
jgi:hypothetical protein